MTVSREVLENYPITTTFLRPEDVLASRNTKIIATNYTPWFEESRKTVALGYSKLANPPLDPDEVYELLCKDGYDINGYSKTFTTLTTNPYTKEDEVSGTLRLVIGKDEVGEDRLPALDAMRLMDVLPDWPHRLNNIPDGRTGELGRFVIPDQFRTIAMRHHGVPSAFTRSLVDNAIETASGMGIQVVYAIMPSYVTRLLKEAGIPFAKIKGTSLREYDPEVKAIFDKFNIYWRDSKPGLYIIPLYQT